MKLWLFWERGPRVPRLLCEPAGSTEHRLKVTDLRVRQSNDSYGDK